MEPEFRFGFHLSRSISNASSKSKTVHKLPKLILLLAFTLTGGCGIAIGLPPLRIAQSVGVGRGQLQPRHAQPAAAVSVLPVYATRIGIHPLQAVPSLFTRPFDAGIGWQLEYVDGSGYVPHWKNGPYLDLSLRLFHRPMSASTELRCSLSTHVDLLLTDDLGWRTGVGFGAAIELDLVGFATLTSASDEAGESSGAAIWGEYGPGIALGFDHRFLDGQDYTVLTAALVFRIPMMGAYVGGLDVRSAAQTIHRPVTEPPLLSPRPGSR